MSTQAFQTIPDNELSLRDVIEFLTESWRTIAFTCFLGILVAARFVLLAPDQYQATAQIQMAQININNNNSSPLGVNIEDPNLLMARFKLPTTYSDRDVKACGFDNSSTPFEDIASIARFSAVKGVDSMIEIKINHVSKELAVTCANALFENIKASQSQIIKPYVEEAKALLLNYQNRLSNSQALVSRADKSGAALSAAYLANRDEVKFLTEESMRLNSFITTANTRQARLVSPIYASDRPIPSKKFARVLLGLFAGLFIGILCELLRKVWLNYKLG